MSEATFAEFTENVTITLPHLSSDVMNYVESVQSGHRLIVEVAAIHEGLTANFNYYPGDSLAGAVESWTSPYPKPILLNHDLNVDPIGRVMSASMDTEADGSNYTRLQIAVTAPEAIAKILDQRYLTGSVGGKSEEALCSVCGKDWAEASMFSVPCKHTRGKTYKGKLAYLERRDLSFHEYSFVNAPADKRSSVRSVSTGAAEADEWDSSVRIFDLNMDKQEIFEFTESENRNVLSSLRKKEAAPLYHQLKGAFLSALATDENEKESEVSADTTETDDVLAVIEQLSDDLAADTTDEEASSEEEVPAAEDEENDEEAKEEETPEEEAAPEASEEDKEEEAATDADVIVLDGDADEAKEEAAEEEGEPAEAGEGDEEDQVDEGTVGQDAQGQERPHEDPDRDSKFATPNAKNEKPSKRDVDHTRDSDDAPTNVEEPAADAAGELEETREALELRVTALQEREQALLEENTRLKKALHRTLAERVVDTKIALGACQAEDRAEMLEEHSTRTAASLADSLRDLGTVTPRPHMPQEADQPQMAVGDNGNVVTDGEPVVTEEEDTKILVAEDVFVDALMGRRKL
jgi:hypothetical protein